MAKRQGKLFGKEQEIIAKYNSGMGYEQLGREYDVSGSAIHKMLKKNNVLLRPKKITPEETKLKIIQLYKDGKSMEEAGKPFGLGSASVLSYLREYNVPSRSAEEAHRIYPINEDFFDNIDTEEKAYFLGFLYADGCNQMAHFYSVNLSLDVLDEEILYKLSRLIYKEEKHVIHQVKRQDRTHEGKGIEMTLNINSKHICLQMLKLGVISRKTFYLDYPKWMPEHLHRHFIRGYFDGDGSINNETKRMSGCKIVSTKQFLDGIKNIIPVNSTMYKCDDTNDKNTYYLIVNGNRHIHNFLNWIYAGSKIHLQRKYAAYLRFCEKMDTINEKMLEGTRGYPVSYIYKNFPDFFEPITVNGLLLNKANVKTLSEEERRHMSYDVFHYFRSRGFAFFTKRPLLDDYKRIVNYSPNINSNIICGNYIGTQLCKYYCNDFYTTSIKGSISIVDAFNDDKMLLKCIQNRLCLDWNYTEFFNISYASIVKGFTSSAVSYNITIFKPSVAKFMYLKYSNENDIVYDFSAGWGGRMLGAAASKRQYIGVDPLTIPSLTQLKNDLSLDNITLINGISEDFEMEENSIDFAFSSPPYYNIEQYSQDNTQSYNKGEEYFYDVYWKNTLQNIKKALKPGKYLAINIKNMPKMLKTATDIFGNNIEEIMLQISRIHLNKQLGKNYETIYIFKK